MSAMSVDMALEEDDRIKHQNCDHWGHCKATPIEEREHRTMTELAVWLVLALAAVWMLAQFGIVKP